MIGNSNSRSEGWASLLAEGSAGASRETLNTKTRRTQRKSLNEWSGTEVKKDFQGSIMEVL
jgi:hypothetical protein